MTKKLSLSAENEHFWSLQKRDQRTAIAADVINQILQKKLTAVEGVYVGLNGGLSFSAKADKKLDNLFAGNTRTNCRACALGACFIGLANLGDKLVVDDVFNKPFKERGRFNSNIDPSLMRGKLREFFTPMQLTLIESAFEVEQMIDDKLPLGLATSKDKEIKMAIKFGERYKTGEERMLAIMKNIRKNRGTFKP